MAITQEDIAQLAKLAGLQLDDAEKAQARQDLARILDLITELQAVDTQGIPPMAHPLAAHQDITLRLRDDVAQAAHTLEERDTYLKNAPAAHDGLFLVPTVIE